MKQYTEAEIRENLATKEAWVRRALIRLYERQTEFEQTAEHTQNYNLRGFMPCDATMFTRFAKYIQKHPERALSPKQLAYCGMRSEKFEGRIRMWRGQPAICKYAKQLLKVIEEDRKEAVQTA